MADNDEKKVPTIILKLTDAEKFMIEVDWQNCKSMAVVRAMLNEAVESVKKEIADLEAAEFGAKMNAAAMAHLAMQKKPSIL